MFQRTTANQRVTTRSQAHTSVASSTVANKHNSENAVVKAKSAVSTTSAAVVAARTTKRRALGDMTNSQQAQNGAAVVAGKEGKKTAAAKPSVVTKSSTTTTARLPVAAQQKATVTSKTTAGAPAAPALRARARRASAQGAAKVQPVANKDVADVVKTSTTTVTLDTESDKENGSDGAKTRVNLVEDVRASAAKRQRIEDDVCVDSDDDGANVSSEDLDVAELLPQVDEPECVWDDLDEDDAGDPMMVSEYVVEIFEYMRELEMKTLPDPNYVVKQRDFQWKMRSILIDWLVEVHHKFKLLPETLFLAVNIIDRFLTVRTVPLDKLQLVGITALLIAAKYEEVYVPSVNQIVYIADGAYTNNQIIKAERYMLSMLQFNLQFPNPLNFLRRCSKADDYNIQTRTLAKYFMETMLLDERFLPIPPSQTAAAGLCFARFMVYEASGDDTTWDDNLTHYSGYTKEQLLPVIMSLITHLQGERKYTAIHKKYSTKQFYKASKFADEWIASSLSDSASQNENYLEQNL